MDIQGSVRPPPDEHLPLSLELCWRIIYSVKPPDIKYRSSLRSVSEALILRPLCLSFLQLTSSIPKGELFAFH